jgi:hypothetical protein
MKTTAKDSRRRVVDLGGYRTVVLTNGRDYVTQFNSTFAIVQLGAKADACRMFLKDAVEVIRELGRYGVHQLWAEVVNAHPEHDGALQPNLDTKLG